jgi:hypothetical protein
MGGPGSGARPKGQDIDWDDREAGEAARKLAAAREAVSSLALSRALEAYEAAPPLTGRENRMRLAIHAVMRKPKQPPGES